jgi:peptidoglycan DL-endopeptidase CwlO
VARPPLPPRTTRYLRRTAVVVASLSLALGGIVAPSLPAQAAPSIQQQIDNDNQQLEVYAEQYNEATVRLAADKKVQSKLATQMAPLLLQASLADSSLSAIATALYTSGGGHRTLQAMMDSSNTSTMLNELGALNEMARDQKLKIDGAVALVSQYKTKKIAQDKLVAKDQTLVASLAASKKKMEAGLKLLNSLGGGGNGGPGGGPSGKSFTKAQIMANGSCPRQAGSGKGAIAAKKACSLLWQPNKKPSFVWYILTAPNANHPNNYDCSGLTMTAWKAAGVSLNHFTGDQWSETNGRKWTATSLKSLQVGDLLFYYRNHTHVALYIGDGMIAQAAHTGAPLEVSPIGSPTGWGRP